MPTTYDPSTDVGKVRLLIPDTDVPDNAVFEDADIEAFLDLEGDIRLAAAQALDSIAVSEALVQKVLKTMDTQTDGAKLAEALMKRAASLRAQAAQVDEDDDDQFAVAEFADPVFGQREWLARQNGLLL